MGLLDSWCLRDVILKGAQGDSTEFYSCAQMSFVRHTPPPHRRIPGREVWAARVPRGGGGPRAPRTPSPCTHDVPRVHADVRGWGDTRGLTAGAAPPGLCLQVALRGPARLRWTGAILLPFAGVTTLH